MIEVSDPDPRPPVITDAGPDSESGRGLTLVQALSKEWSYFYPPAGGKTVCCTIPFDKHDLEVVLTEYRYALQDLINALTSPRAPQ